MKIALLSNPWLKVPPDGYGGAEWVVFNLVEGLVKKGHDVTLYATGDSKTSATLKYIYPKALGNDLELKLNPHIIVNHLYHFMTDVVPLKFDLIHSHAGRLAQYFLPLQKTPFIHTLHGNYTSYDDIMTKNTNGFSTFQQFASQPFISISRNQQKIMPGLNYVGTVYNGIKAQDFTFSKHGGNKIVWLGRITPTKGVKEVLQIAYSLQLPVEMGGWVDNGDKPFFISKIEPLLNNRMVLFKGEIKSSKEKSLLFTHGKVLLLPLKWEEPFGLVMVEAMACGTPVIAYAKGSATEVIQDGKTGFLVNASDSDIRGEYIIKDKGMQGLKAALKRLYSLSPGAYEKMRVYCRKYVENKFSVEKMVDNYEFLYEKLLSKSK